MFLVVHIVEILVSEDDKNLRESCQSVKCMQWYLP